MMIRIFAVGKLKDPNLRECFEEYRIRISRFTRLEVAEVKRGADLLRRLKDEWLLVVLDEKGESLTSEALSNFIKENYLHRDIVFLVGGPEGLDESTLGKSSLRLSLSKMTFTSQIARLLLIEQIYRAFTLLKGVKYHKSSKE